MSKPLSVDANGKLVYQLNQNLAYGTRLNASEYTGEVIYRQGTVERTGAGAERGGAAPATAPGLLYGHISSSRVFNPFDEGQIEIWEGAALIKVVKQGRVEPRPEGVSNRRKRGKIHGFSRSSRRRMRLLLAKVCLDEGLPLFGTTTYPDIFPDDAAKFKRDLETLVERLKRRFKKIGLVWRLEFKERRSGVNVGKIAPHFHWLLWNVPRKFGFQVEKGQWAKMTRCKDGTWLETVKFRNGENFATVARQVSGEDRFTEWLSRNWYDVVGTGELKHFQAGTNVKLLTSKREVFFYVSKYLGKVVVEQGCECPGRFWGVVNPKNIPMGRRRVVQITGNQASQLMRFMRRFVHAVTRKKYRFNRWSMSCLCNADFWMAKLPHLLNVPSLLKASSVAAVVSYAATTEPDYEI